jgi:hypothetical protein
VDSIRFRERVSAMTTEVGTGLDIEHCGRIYDERSGWVHGDPMALFRREQGLGDPEGGPTDAQQEDAFDRTARTQDALRAVLRRCIEDSEFRRVFDKDEAIESRWPG